jgi:hypothetical protein
MSRATLPSWKGAIGRWNLKIIEARAHPSIDNLQIAEMKRRKLLVKDEIARL